MREFNESTRDDTIILEAAVRNLPQLMAFLDAHMDAWDCPLRARMAIELAAEEVYVNIASYAYAPGTGAVTVQVGLESADTARTAVITFTDQGKPYDPLARKDPDLTLSAKERQIGGLGIFLTKQNMDEVTYAFKDGSNVLTMKKYL